MSNCALMVVMLSDMFGCFYILYALAGHVFDRNQLKFMTKLSGIVVAIGLFMSFWYSLDRVFGDGILPTWEIPLWGFKDLGIAMFMFFLFRDLKRQGML